jgi:aspartyl-tRNA synthetase
MQMDRLELDLEALGLELVIGLETHVRLNTKSKMFCACPNQEAGEPNTNICPVCTGQMGVLPAANKEAVMKAILFGKAAAADISPVISWDRKHYEYPDLPKNFQLTQFFRPVIKGGQIDCFREDGTVFSVQLEQAHIEEDAAKLVHEKNSSLVDFNKSGVPLIEIVTKPCMSRITDAAVYAQYVHRIVQNLGISEANLEKGEFKSDVSVSLRKKGSSALNPRTEIKNLNSFKFMVEALQEEISKQLDYYKEHQAFRPDQTTVLFDADLKKTKTMRKKEFAADYRFAAEPDIPAVDISAAIADTIIDMSLLPYPIEEKMIKGGVRPVDAKFFTSEAVRSKVFLAADKAAGDVLLVAKVLLNNMSPEDYPKLKNTAALAEIVALFKDDKITSVLLGQAVAKIIAEPDFDYKAFFAASTISLEKIDDAVKKVIAENNETAEEIRKGNQGKAGVLVGKVAAILGKAAPGKLARERILHILSAENAAAAQEIEQQTGQEQGSKETAADADERRALPHDEIIVKDSYRTHTVSDISEASVGQKAQLGGWVSSLRDHGDLVFIDLRDCSGEVMQIRMDRLSFAKLDEIAKIKPESVISVAGTVQMRSADDYNPGIKTGKIELEATELDLLNMANTLPFEIKRATKTNEATRFRYKYLDHRNPDSKRAIVNRHRIVKLMRDVLDSQGFLEIETPILTAGTDEGAREFIVPSRKFAGSFYTLPQAPQQFKQMLMVSGYEKYFQIARCFRDEDSRGDRQPEFTQLDIEMSFASMQDIIDLNTKLFTEIVDTLYAGKWRMKPFQLITYKDAMDKYGCDRPDLRFGLEMQDITDIVKDTSFKVFLDPIEAGGIVKCIKVDAAYQKQRISKGQIEKLTAIAQENGLGGLAYIIVNGDGLQSPIIKYLGGDIAARIISRSEAKPGDIVFFSAADYKTANKALDAVRQELGDMLKLIDSKLLCPAWVIDFPMFELTDEGRWTFTHNPFSMPKREHVRQHLEGRELGSIIAQQYDLILNGFEIGGGSVRAHVSEILEATYINMGYSREEMLKSVGQMYKAFQYGAPPHGGIAWGVDRLVMLLEKKQSIREVLAFPKTGSGEDLLFNSPGPLPEKKINEANIRTLSRPADR